MKRRTVVIVSVFMTLIAAQSFLEPAMAADSSEHSKGIVLANPSPVSGDTLRAFSEQELGESEISFTTQTDRFSGTTTRRLKSPVSIKAGRGIVGWPRVYLDLIRVRAESGDSMLVLQVTTYDKDWAFYEGTITLILDNHTRVQIPSDVELETKPKREVGSGYVTETYNIPLSREEVNKLGSAVCGEAMMRGERKNCQFVLNRDFIAAVHAFKAELDTPIEALK